MCQTFSITTSAVMLAAATTLLLLPVVISAQKQKPRRDEEYPPAGFNKNFKIIHDVCVEKTGAKDEDILEFSDGDITDNPTPELKCYMNCLFHELNIVDDDGEMHYESLKRIIPGNIKDIVKIIVDGCESHVPAGLTQCERAWSWHVCWKEMDARHYFLP